MNPFHPGVLGSLHDLVYSQSISVLVGSTTWEIGLISSKFWIVTICSPDFGLFWKVCIATDPYPINTSTSNRRILDEILRRNLRLWYVKSHLIYVLCTYIVNRMSTKVYVLCTSLLSPNYGLNYVFKISFGSVIGIFSTNIVRTLNILKMTYRVISYKIEIKTRIKRENKIYYITSCILYFIDWFEPVILTIWKCWSPFAYRLAPYCRMQLLL